ncbi:MAG: leucine--tRNA ligase [Patescibacteria group bacterium]
MEYNPKEIEPKWQKTWADAKAFEARDDSPKPKYYCLIEFPYPSGDGLHAGHVRSNTAMDVVARKRRAEGYEVLYPIGWDAFGLPTENYAIKTGKKPALVTKENTDTFRRQLQALGFSFDWSREVNTTDPSYYRWTQWIFLELHKAGLAYKAKMEINWCPKDKIGLANEEVVDGCCERCGTKVEKREKEQWMLAITKYADRLEKDLDTVDYLEKIKAQQRNWIGKSDGLLFSSPVKDTDIVIETFSAHFEAFCADTFVVIAPNHPLLPRLLDGVSNKEEILAEAKAITERRSAAGHAEIKEVEGVFTGRYIVDPVGNGELPIWIANYALAEYGTGIVKCSAHDERDFAFAKKYNIPLKPVLFPSLPEERTRVENREVCYSDMEQGILSEPADFAGKTAGQSRDAISAYAVEKGLAKKKITYKLRDWVFSRQRYWGEPIPMIHCEKCDWVPVPLTDLPVTLPDVENYQPTDTGESPLAAITEWVNTICPSCKGPARRETDTMPNWAGSSWYYLRYVDPKNDQVFCDPKKLAYWSGANEKLSTINYKLQNAGPVDWYNGGMEHTTLHLLYSRFWHKFLFDQGHVPTSEPYAKRTSHGLILADGGVKMSKSKGNVVNPDAIVLQFGADSLRVYEMFMGPFDQAIAWNTDGLVGARRFLERAWRAALRVDKEAEPSSALLVLANQTIEKVSHDIEELKMNTAVAALMILLRDIEKEERVALFPLETLIRLLAPFAPHIAEELWEKIGHSEPLYRSHWPKADSSKLELSLLTIAVQVNGKVRDTLSVPRTISEEEVRALALGRDSVKRWLEGKEPKKIVYVPGRLLSIVAE